MLRQIVASLILALLVATPCFAGTVYIPILGGDVDGISYNTEVTVANPSSQDVQFTNLFIPSGTDGTDRDEADGQTILLLAGRTQVIGFDSAEAGMLEVDTDSDLIFSARLVGNQDGEHLVGGWLPVVNSANVVAPGAAAYLQGWQRDDARFTDFGLLNLGFQEAECTFDMMRNDGSQVFSNAVIPWLPLSQRDFPDTLGLLGISQVADIWVKASCDQRFFPYATVVDRQRGAVRFLGPSGLGSSSLLPPEVPGACPAGATCFEELGTFFVPTVQAPTRGIYMPVPPGQYTKIHLQMEVVHGGWQNPSSGLHNIFWFVLERNFDMVGYLNFRGPNRNEILYRHGMGLVNGAKPRVVTPFAGVPGELYAIDYTYDMGLRRIDLVVSNRGQEVARIVAAPNVSQITVEPGKRFLIGLSFEPGVNPNEPPTYGWQYRNLRVEYFPR